MPCVYAAGLQRLAKAMGTENVPEFNDDPGTTKEDVLLAFKRAIEEGY